MEPITVGLVLTGASVALLTALHAQKVVVRRLGRWPDGHRPAVWLARGCPVSVTEVHTAIARLADEGVDLELGAVNAADVIDDELVGAIVIRRRDRHVHATHAGETRVRLGDDGLIRSVVCFLPDLDAREGAAHDDGVDLVDVGARYSDEERLILIAHELAHAVGWLHCETALLGRTKKDRARLGIVGRKSGHLMHTHVDKMGWDTQGMG